MMLNHFISRTVTALWVAATLGIVSQAAAAPTSLGQSFNLDQAEEFANYKTVVRSYMRTKKARTGGDACVLGLIADDGSKFAWVLLEQGGELILYEDGETDLSRSRRRLNLNKDVVANASDLHGSTYLITRDWLMQLQTACRQHGVHVRTGASP